MKKAELRKLLELEENEKVKAAEHIIETLKEEFNKPAEPKKTASKKKKETK